MSYSYHVSRLGGITSLVQQANDAADKYAAMLASGKLSQVRSDIGGSCAGNGCAFDPLKPSKLYVVKKLSGNTLVPAGYMMSGPSEMTWTGNAASAPWPGTNASASVTAPSGMTPEQEAAILRQSLPDPVPEASFIRRNAKPLLIGGGVLFLGMLGLVIFVTAD